MDADRTKDRIVSILAKDHFDPDGSVVHSGMRLADAVLAAIEAGARVEIDLREVKGAGSSYFNIFLRRIDEALGISAMDRCIQVRFASKVQEMVFERSLESMRRGPRMPPTKDISEHNHSSAFSSLLRSLARLFSR